MRPEAPLALALLLALSAFAEAGEKKAAPRPPVLSRDGGSSVMLAQTNLNAGKLAEAEKLARAAVRSDGDSPLPHVVLAMVLAKKGEQDKAYESFGKALAIAPADGAVLNAYASWQCERGDFVVADETFRRALADPRYARSVQSLANAGRCAMLAKDWPRADAYLRRAVAVAPINRRVLLMLAQSQLQMHRPFEARAFVQRSEALGPDATTLALGVQVEQAAGDLVAAERYRKLLREQFPNLAPTGEGARTP